MATIATLAINLIGNASGLQSALGSAQASIKKTADSLQSVGQKMTLGVTAPIVGFGAMALKTAGDFQQAMANVNAIANGSEADLAALTAAAEDLGRTTSFSASQAAEGMSFLAMAGFQTNEIIAAMPGLLATAAAGNTDLATTADIVSNVLSGFNIEASETGRVADVLTKTFTSSNTNLQQLGDAMKYVAPLSASLGVSLEDSATAVAFMSDAGIQASMAGTALRGILSRLAAPTARSAEVMQDLGINVYDTQGRLKAMPAILQEFQTKMGGMTDAQRSAALQVIVGTEAMSGFLALMARGPEEFAAFSQGLTDSAGTAETVAAKQLATFQGQVKLFQSALEGLMITVGNAILPIVTSVVERVTPMVGRLTELFDSLSPSTQRLALGIAAVAAAAGPVLVGLGMMVGAVGNLVPLMGTLATVVGGALSGAFAFLVSPLGLVVAGLAALFYFDVGGIRGKFVALGQSIWEFGQRVVEVTPSLATDLKDAMAWIWDGKADNIDWWWDIADGLQAIVGFSDETSMALGDFLYDAGVQAGELISSLRAAGSAFKTFFASDDFGSFLGELKASWQETTTAFTGILQGELSLDEFRTQMAEGLAKIPAAFEDLFTGVDFQTLIGELNWDDYISALTWENVVATLTDWGTYITSLDWTQIVTTVIDWATWIPALTWTSIITTVDWALYLTAITWEAFVTALDWALVTGEGIDWTAFITALTDWNTYVPAIDWFTYIGSFAWDSFVEKLEWTGAIDTLEDWGQYIPEVSWAEFVPALEDWGTWISDLAWTEYVSTLSDWATFVSPLSWVEFVFALDWASFVPTLTWPSITWPGWKSFIPTFTWPDIPSIPDNWWQWFNPFGGGGGDPADPNTQLGTQYWRGGRTWVGEDGPELVTLPRGAQVYPNRESMAMAGAGGSPVVIQNMTVRSEQDIHRVAYEVEDIRRRRQRR